MCCCMKWYWLLCLQMRDFYCGDSVLSVKGLMYPTSQTVDETREARTCFLTFEEGQNPGMMDISANNDRTFAEFIFHQSIVDGKFQRYGSKRYQQMLFDLRHLLLSIIGLFI